ncbi:MAG: PspC domain-containing protein [Paludibacteraceae bacterium]
MLGGVCAGLAEYCGIDPTLVRVIYAALTLFSACFPGIVLYIIMLIIMPPAEYHD